jgi:hypothetical protein
MIDQPRPGPTIEESKGIGQLLALQFLLGFALSRDERFDQTMFDHLLQVIQAGIDADTSSANDPLVSTAARETAVSIYGLARALRGLQLGVKP